MAKYIRREFKLTVIQDFLVHEGDPQHALQSYLAESMSDRLVSLMETIGDMNPDENGMDGADCVTIHHSIVDGPD